MLFKINPSSVTTLSALVSCVIAACLSGGDEKILSNALARAGRNGKVQLCQYSVFIVNDAVNFAADGQELSTQGYPLGPARATIRMNVSEPTNNTVLIIGLNYDHIKVLNLIVDGNKPKDWQVPPNSGANIEVGGRATGATVVNTASRNPRGWSCLHVAEGGDLQFPYSCTHANISHNDIGPAGTETQWADGISHACAKSLIVNNTITGSTDGGIVLFGAPETIVTSNTIVSSTTQRGFSAINLVDYLYEGNYSGVRVASNLIVAKRMLNVGILMGFSAPGVEYGAKYYLSGPVMVVDNTFVGNMVNAIALNGWKNGITISGSNISSVTSPNSRFADANVGYQDNDCTSQPATWRVFNSNTKLNYWSPGVRGKQNLEAGFVNSSTGDMNYVICAKPAIAATRAYAAGMLNAGAGGDPIAFLHKGIGWQFQSDNNLVAVDYSSPDESLPIWWSGFGGYDCNKVTKCRLRFGRDANLVNTVNGSVVWQSNTNNGQNNTLVFLNQSPWVQIRSPAGKVIWKADDPT